MASARKRVLDRYLKGAEAKGQYRDPAAAAAEMGY